METAVLVAIAIPVFTAQLEKSREATDLANARSAYAELMVYVLDGTTGTLTSSVKGCTITEASGIYTATITGLNQTVEGWATTDAGTAVAGVTSTGSPSGKTGKCTITYTPNTTSGGAGGTVAIAWA